ncbi:MAG: OmpA family protein [Cytophagales bacterium]|nr:OmpA family protein [Cytophagales bacterium]
MYYTRRLDESWTKWSMPVNLGKGVNSRLDEIFISTDGQNRMGYIESFGSSSKQRDIIQVQLPAELRSQEEAPDLASQPITEPNASTAFLMASADREAAPQSVPSVPLPDAETEKLRALISAKNLGLDLTAVSLENQTLSLKVKRNVYFDFNQSTISSEQTELLAKVKDYLNQKPGTKLVIRGYSDPLGGEKANAAIQKARALEAKNALVAQGISPDRLEVDMNHDNRALATNDDDKEGRELNRRVELYLVELAWLLSSAK